MARQIRLMQLIYLVGFVIIDLNLVTLLPIVLYVLSTGKLKIHIYNILVVAFILPESESLDFLNPNADNNEFCTFILVSVSQSIRCMLLVKVV